MKCQDTPTTIIFIAPCVTACLTCTIALVNYKTWRRQVFVLFTTNLRYTESVWIASRTRWQHASDAPCRAHQNECTCIIPQYFPTPKPLQAVCKSQMQSS